MRVLLAHKFFRLVGGADRFFFETGRLLEDSGHDVAYLSTRHPDNESTPFAPYFVRAYEYGSANPYLRLRALAAAIYNLEARRSMTRLIDEFRPDLVHMFSIFTHLSTSVIDACVERGVPVLMSCNDYKHICPNYRLYHHERVCEECKGERFYRATVNRCCHESLLFSTASMLEAYAEKSRGFLGSKVDMFLFASEFMAQLTEHFWEDRPFKKRILRNPFTPTLSPVSSDDGYLLFFGRLIKEKGVQQLLRAAKLIPDIEVKIVGDGDHEQVLRTQAAESGLNNVEFCGPLWGAALDDVLTRARAVVVPSVWYENFPYVVLQAFAAGKPVIGSDRGGIPEMIQHDARGLTYPAEDHTKLADAVRRLWADQPQRTRMGRAAQAYVSSEYGVDRFMDSLLDTYETVLAEAHDEPRVSQGVGR